MKGSLAASGESGGARLEGAGEWTLHEVLGSGGSATVYRATRGVQKSALKVMHAHLSGDRAWLRRVRREVALLERIEHVGVARILDAGSLANGVPFIALELLEGRSLEAVRRERGGRLPVPEALAYVRGVLGALAAVHELGIVHRDLKPSNVFVTAAGELKVLDFGIAAASEGAANADDTAASTTRGILGTPAYMAPEQARGRWDQVDARSDLWAVGAMLFTLVSGEFVHIAGTENERLGLAMSRPARSLSHAAPWAGAALSSVVARALAYDRDARFQSAEAFLSALDGAERAEAAVEAACATVSDSPAAPRARRRWPALFGTVLVLGTVVTVGFTLAARAQSQTRSAVAAARGTSTSQDAPLAAPNPDFEREGSAPLPRAVLAESSARSIAPVSPAARPSGAPPRAGRRPPTKSSESIPEAPAAPAPENPRRERAIDDVFGVRTEVRSPSRASTADPLERRD